VTLVLAASRPLEILDPVIPRIVIDMVDLRSLRVAGSREKSFGDKPVNEPRKAGPVPIKNDPKISGRAPTGRWSKNASSSPDPA
jgi:hypothetical protein